ncbi:Transcription elongation factor A [Metarhizium robertsii ARSEF 23]|uniref:Transcription elongation factor A n=1 Tax=Metarhizium robertsii (strain ARSEF 23 / ATCC MYA-3075) TaxID=655844 RepID=E9FD36_METRA|nr:Transcription elongation factor A [Metarhizium robertsii ARSEF 23]EFY94341.1 Transcription elongation factor A [Metarhizium robertsii ARSEF 23]
MRHQWLWAVVPLFLGQAFGHPNDAVGKIHVRGGSQSTQKPPADVELPGDPPKFVFRGDERPPNTVKEAGGFFARGHGMDLSGEELERASSLNGYEAQKEQAVVEGLPWDQVEGWYDVSKLDAKKVERLENGEKLEELFEANPEFNPKYEPLHGSGEVPKLAGFRSNSGAWGEQPWKAFKDQKVSKSFDEFVQSISAGSATASKGEEAQGEQDSPKGDEAEAGAGTSNNAESEPRPESNRRDFKSACSGNALKRAISCTKVEEAKLSEANDLKAKYLAEGDKGLIEYENKHFIAAGLKQLAKDDVKVLKKLLPAKAQLFTMDFVLALDKDSPPFWKALVDGLENNEFTLSDCQIGFKKALSKTIDKRYTEFDSPEHALTSLINIGTDLWDTVETAFPANFWMDLVEELPTECRDIAAATTPEEKLKVANEGVDTLIQAWSNLTPLGRANDRWTEDSVLHPEMTTGQKILDVMYDTFTHFSVFGWVFSLAFPDVAKSVAKIPIKRIDQHSYWEV